MTKRSMICAIEAGFSKNRWKLFGSDTGSFSALVRVNLLFCARSWPKNNYRFDKTSKYL